MENNNIENNTPNTPVEDGAKMEWYIIETLSAYESKVKSNLEQMIENYHLEDKIDKDKISILVEEDIVERNGKRKVVQRKKFPRYIFLKMIYDANVGYLIKSIHGVASFVGPQGKPLALTQDEVKRAGLEKITAEEFDIMVGNTVRVVSGPLENFIGVVDEVDVAKQKVRVIVQMFGRQTPVDLDFNQIEKVAVRA